MKEKSTAIAEEFAKEIKNMTEDKILFLSFVFIGPNEVTFVREWYPIFLRDLKLKGTLDFDSVLNWFKDDGKIEICLDDVLMEECINFSHPEYSKALDCILLEDGCITEINEKIFSKFLLKLYEYWIPAHGYVAGAIAEHFDKFPEDVRNLLFKLCEDDDDYISVSIIPNYNKLPEKVQNLVFKLAEKDENKMIIALSIVEEFNEVPEDVRNLLFKLCEDKYIAGEVRAYIEDNFDDLPKNVQNLRTKLLNDNKIEIFGNKVHFEDIDGRFSGEYHHSRNQRYIVTFSRRHYKEDKSGEMVKIPGRLYLIENKSKIMWKKEIATLDSLDKVFVTNDGNVILCSNKEYCLFDKEGQEIFCYKFNSNIAGGEYSEKHSVLVVTTAGPDNKVYCFDVNGNKLDWIKNNPLEPPYLIRIIKFSDNNKILLSNQEDLRGLCCIDLKGNLIEGSRRESDKKKR